MSAFTQRVAADIFMGERIHAGTQRGGWLPTFACGTHGYGVRVSSPEAYPPYFRPVRTYGFTPGFAPYDVVDFVVECIRKAARWNKKELLVITLDIKTAFDAMKHNTIHASN